MRDTKAMMIAAGPKYRRSGTADDFKSTTPMPPAPTIPTTEVTDVGFEPVEGVRDPGAGPAG